LTDLPPGLDPARMAQAMVANARLRDGIADAGCGLQVLTG
jgi:hypothetical protein